MQRAVAAPCGIEVRTVFAQLGERLFPGEASGLDNRSWTFGGIRAGFEIFPNRC